MNLEQAIHERWASAAALNALLPAASVRTGLVHDATMPYATLSRAARRSRCRTNAGDALDEVTLNIAVWHRQFDAGQAIADQVRAAFDRSAFDLPGGGRVAAMHCFEESALQHDDGVWQWSMTFSVQVHLPLGY